MTGWEDLDFWFSDSWKRMKERLERYEKSGGVVCPTSQRYFSALAYTPYSAVTVAIIGQDPYPNPDHATGLAFSVPDEVSKFPPTLNMIFREYENDLHLPRPKYGDLSRWTDHGVFLWNAFPTCESGRSLSHACPEWVDLTTEIVQRLDSRAIVFAFVGSRAREYAKFVRDSEVVEVGHPSPRANSNHKSPFIGSRFFTTINAKLVDSGLKPIDWRL